MSDMFTEVSIDDLVGVGSAVPTGRFVVRALNVEAGLSKAKNTPQLVVTYEIIEGEHSGLEARCYYPIAEFSGETKGKAWKIHPGLMELKKIFAAVGKPFEKGYKFQLGRADVPGSTDKSLALYRKEFMSRVGQTRLEMNVVDDKSERGKRKDNDGNPMTNDKGEQLYNTRVTIVGPADRNAAFAAASTPSAPAASAESATPEDKHLALLAALGNA